MSHLSHLSHWISSTWPPRSRPGRAAWRLCAQVLVAVWALVLVTEASVAAAGQANSRAEDVRDEISIPSHPSALRFGEWEWSPPAADTVRLLVPRHPEVAVFAVPAPLVSLVRAAVAFPVGDQNDPRGQDGVASMTAAMMRRGGTQQRSADEFDLAVADLGAEIQTFGGEGRTVVTLVCLADVFPEALDLLFEMIVEPAFETERLEQARRALQSSFAARNDDVTTVARRRWNHLLFGRSHPRTRELVPQTLARISRESLLDFHRRELLQSTPVIALSGGLEVDGLAEVLAVRLDRFGVSSENDTSEQPVTAAPAPAAGGTSPRESASAGFYHVPHPSLQGRLMLGVPGLEIESFSDHRVAAALVLQEILDGRGVLSRLRSRLRSAENLAYSVNGRFEFGSREQVPWVEISVAVEPSGVVEAVRAIAEELRRLAEVLPSEGELDFAKRGLLDRFPFFFEDPESVAGRYAEDVLLRRPHAYWLQYRERVGKVTANEVRALADEVIDLSELRILWVGPPLDQPTLRTWLLEMELGALQPLVPFDPVLLRPRGEPP